MKYRQWVCLVLFFAMALHMNSATSFAAEKNSVSMQSLLTLGLEENLGLRASRFTVSAAHAAIAIEEGAFDPEFFATTDYQETQSPYTSSTLTLSRVEVSQLSGSAGLRKQFPSGLNTSLALNSIRTEDNPTSEALNPRYQTGLSLELTQPLLRNAGSATNLLALNLAKGKSQQEQYRFLQQAQTLALDIERGYFDLIRSRLTERLRKEAVQLTRELLEGNQRKLEAEIIPITEVQEAETALAERELEYVLVQQQREVQAHRLNGLLNNRLPLSLATPLPSFVEVTELILPENAHFPDFLDALKSAELNRPDLKISAINIKNSNLSETSANNRVKPQLDLSLHLSTDGLAGSERPIKTSPYQGDWTESFSSMTSADGYQWRAGLNFSMPLGNRSFKAASRVAQHHSRQAKLSHRDLLNQVATELREQRTQTQRLGQLVEISSRFQELAELSFKQESRRLEEGLSDSFRVLTFQEKMIVARISRVSALVEFNKSLTSLNYAMGNNLLRHGIVTDLSSKEIRFEEI